MTFKASQRGAVPAFIVMDVMRAAAALEAQGREIIHAVRSLQIAVRKVFSEAFL